MNNISVCDNCTLTLLASSDDLGYLIQTETGHIDLEGIPAPWPHLLMFENTTKRLSTKLNEYFLAKDRIENYNDLQIEKVTL